MRYTDLLKSKDDIIQFRCPGEVKGKLQLDAKRMGISTSKLALHGLTIFLALSPAEQKALLEGTRVVAVVRRTKSKSVPIETVKAEIVEAKKSSKKKVQR